MTSIIHNFDIVCVAFRPAETHPPLIIDANTVLTGTITSKFLEPVTRRNPQICKRTHSVHNYELLEHGAAKRCRKSLRYYTQDPGKAS